MIEVVRGGMMKLKIFSVAFYFVSFFLIDFPIKLIILKFPAVKVEKRKKIFVLKVFSTIIFDSFS